MLPLKIRVLEYVIDKKTPVTVEDVMKALKDEYGSEKQFTFKRVESYLDQFLGVNFMESDKIEFDDNGELKMSYKMTEYGMTRKKYIPKHSN